MAAHDRLAGAMDGTARVQGAGRGRGHLGGDRPGERLPLRTVKRYLTADAPAAPPAPAKRGPGPRKTDPYAYLIDAWLRRQPKLKPQPVGDLLRAPGGGPAPVLAAPVTPPDPAHLRARHGAAVRGGDRAGEPVL